MARLPSVRLNEPTTTTTTTTERSTLRLFSIPSSIADNSLLRFPWGDTVGIPRPAIFTSDARKPNATGFNELAASIYTRTYVQLGRLNHVTKYYACKLHVIIIGQENMHNNFAVLLMQIKRNYRVIK